MNFVGKLANLRLNTDKVNRVLIYRLGSLGDTIVSLPCFHLIAKTFPNAERRILTNIPVSTKAPGTFDLLHPAGLVHQQMRYPVGVRNPRELWELRNRIREFSPDVLISIMPIRSGLSVWRDYFFFKACGIPQIFGLAFSESLRRCLPLSPGGPIEQEASRLARCIAPLGDAKLDCPDSWSLNLTANERQRSQELLKPLSGRRLLSVSLGTKVQAKDWGEENWTKLMNKLAGDLPEYGLILVGAPEEADLSDRASTSWEGRSVNLCGQLTPRETAAALECAEIFVGHDSGPMHLAASAGRPCVAIFAARNIPRQWFPCGENHTIIYHPTDCMGCGLEVCIEQKKKCITSISVDEVYAAVMQSLSQNRSKPSRFGSTFTSPVLAEGSPNESL